MRVAQYACGIAFSPAKGIVRITIEGASGNNLKDVDAVFGDGLTVVTGASGSGKSTLVFDTLFREAERHFMELFAGSGSGREAPA
tara:strand:- start:817 stop:1071 length:255 start_codon:yes stop_codon:yes gene_type:complete